MAGLFCTWNHTRTLDSSGDDVICVFTNPSNHRIVLHSITISPQGSSGATVPLEFELARYSDTGAGGSDATSELELLDADASETAEITISKGPYSTEPADTAILWTISIHQQSVRPWEAPRELTLPGSAKWGLQYTGTLTPDCVFTFKWEE